MTNKISEATANQSWWLARGLSWVRQGARQGLLHGQDVWRKVSIAAEFDFVEALTHGLPHAEAKQLGGGRWLREYDELGLTVMATAEDLELAREVRASFGVHLADYRLRLESGVSLQCENTLLEESLIGLLRDRKLPVREDGALGLLVASDFESTWLSKKSADLDKLGKPGLLITWLGPCGTVGPLWKMGETACLECLARRVAENRWLRRDGVIPDEHPPGAVAMSLALAVDLAVEFLATGRNAARDTVLQWQPSRGRLRRHSIDRLLCCTRCGGNETHRYRWLPHFSELTSILRTPRELTPRKDWPVRLSGVQYAAPARSGKPGEAIAPGWSIGRGRSLREARKKAVFEALERRSTFWHGHEKVFEATERDLGEMAVSPGKLARLTGAYADDQVIYWVEVAALLGGEKCFIPASLAYFCTPFQEPWSPGAHSTGCALGRSFADACVRGLEELIEREALMIWWRGRFARPAVQWHNWKCAALLRFLERSGLSVKLLDLTTDWAVPVYAAVVETETGIYIGSSCNVMPQAAAENACTELFQAIFSRGTNENHPGFRPKWHWTEGAVESEIDRVPTLPPKSRLRKLLHTADQLGVQVFALDMTRKELGWPVVRMFAPSMACGDASIMPSRLFTVPFKLGWMKPGEPREWSTDPLPI